MKPFGLLFLLLCFLLSACSQQKEDDDKNSIKSAAEERGHEAARQIKEPLKQAEHAKQIQEERDRQLNEAVNQ